MKKIPCLLILSLLLCLSACGAPGGGSSATSASAASAAASTSPADSEPEDVSAQPEYDITAELVVTADYKTTGEEPLLTETATIRFTNTSDVPWDKICLRDYAVANLAVCNSYSDEPIYDLSGSIRAVRDEQGQALTFAAQADPSVVYVTLPEPLQPGARTTITVDFQTLIPCGAERLSWWPTGENYDGNTICLSQAYPVLAAYLEDGWDEAPYFTAGECFFSPCGRFRMTLRLPEDYTVISTGDETRNADGSWTLAAEQVRDFAVIAGNDLAMQTAQAGDVTVRSWYYNSDPSMGEIALQAAVDAVNAFTAAWGDYPYGTLDVVESAYSGGMEYPGLVRISDAYLDLTGDAELGRDGEQELRLTVAHETAHQWFYAVVGNDQYREAWLDESFAVLGELTYQAYLGASEAELSARVAELDAAELPQQYIDLSYDQYYDAFEYGSGYYVNAVYKRGPAFLWKLRDAMGADEFDAFLRDWYAEHSFAEVTTADFRAALSRAAGDDPTAAALVEQYLSPVSGA